jgi:hypothetical protein
VPHLAALGIQILPLLKLLERDFKLGLLIADIEKCMPDPTQKAKDVGQS